MRNTSIILKGYLPSDYKKAVHIMYKAVTGTGYTSLIFPDFIGLYGHGNYDLSMEALKYFTQFGTLRICNT